MSALDPNLDLCPDFNLTIGIRLFGLARSERFELPTLRFEV